MFEVIKDENIARAKEQIEREIKAFPIILYMKGTPENPRCGFSARAISALIALDVDFETRDVLESEALRSAIKEFSDWPTLPQLYVGGKFIGGCDIICALYESGELEQIVTDELF